MNYVTNYKEVVSKQFGDWNETYQKNSFDKKWETTNYQIVFCKDLKIGAISEIYKNNKLFLSEILISSKFQNQGHGKIL